MSKIRDDEMEYLRNCRLMKEEPKMVWNQHASHSGMWVYDIYGEHADRMSTAARNKKGEELDEIIY